MKKFLIATLLCMALTVTMVPMAFAADSNYTECMAAIQEQRTIQDQAHQTAESLRKKGYSDSSAYVQAAKSTWNEAQKAIAGYQKLAQYSDEDIRILTTTVFHEAGHTTEQLRQYVAQVVLNRVEHPSFPNTISEVIFQPGAFSCMLDGQWDEPVADSAYQAARDALAGADPSGGAIYYFNPVTATNAWIWSRPEIITIGKHRFCA